MLLRSPTIDIVLPAAFSAMAFCATLVFARAERIDAVGFCLTMFVGGLLWCHAIAARLPDGDDR